MNDHDKRKIKVQRRKMYGELIRLRSNQHNLINHRLTHSNINTHYNYTNNQIYNHANNPIYNYANNPIYNYTNNPIYNHTNYQNATQYYTYHNLNEHGLINKKLFQSSSITKSIINEFCIICQDNIQLNDIIRTLSCFHRFHINCVDEWFIDKNICPLCKSSF